MIGQSELNEGGGCRHLVAARVPITNKNKSVHCRWGEWRGHFGDILDTNSTISARRSLESSAGVVEEAAHLVLHLKLVGPIPP